MRQFFLLGALAAGIVSTADVQAALNLGDAAPDIAITQWVKGDAVTLSGLKGKKVIVVEFWATWCGPCITSMPHLSKLQKEHADDVVVIGVTKPDPRNSLEKVQKFVQGKGDTMGYTVAFDGDGKTFDNYMRAAGQGGIPTAFIVDKESKVAWMGHPARMDTPLEEILAGKYDIKAAAARMEAERKLRTMQREFMTQQRAGDYAGAARTAEGMLKLAQDSAPFLNYLAWTLLTEDGFKGKHAKLALAAAERCHEVTGGANWMYLDTLALAKFENGKKKKAIELQRKAVELAEKAKAPPRSLEELKERLDMFEKEAD